MFIIFLSVSIYFAFSLKKREKIKLNRESAWPEALDLIISALQSGASISESLSNLGRVGPNAIKNAFKKFEEDVLSGKKFDDCLTDLKKSLPIQFQISYLSVFTLLQSLVVKILSKFYGSFQSMCQLI